MRTRARVVWMLGAAAIVLSAIGLGLGWRRVAAEWRMHMLERAGTQEEAFAVLEALGASAREEPAVAETFARRLGPGWQGATFWFFRYLTHGGPPYHSAGKTIPLLRPFTSRVERDPHALQIWAHYRLWRGLGLREGLSGVLLPGLHGIPVDRAYSPDGEDHLDRAPEMAEAAARMEWLQKLAVQWCLGMDPGTKFPESFEPEGRRALLNRLDETMRKETSDWLRLHRDYLRFDPAQGRCVLVEERTVDEDWLPSRPAAPLPGWSGPAPPMPK